MIILLLGLVRPNAKAVVQRRLTFNADNMATRVVHPGDGTVDIAYDGEAKRAKKSGPGGTTYYYSNEFEQIGATETCYVFAGNLRVAVVKDYANVTYFHKDHLGSSSVVTDVNGDAQEQTRYMPYGGKRGEGAGVTASNYLFTDQELDKESGLYNYDARLYDPVVGRFISPDTVVPFLYHPQSIDRFSYCMNNPLTYTDPSGHQPADSFDVDYGGPGSWGTAPSQRDLSHQVVSDETMIGIGIAGGLMAGGSFAAGTTVATASWNAMVAMTVASVKAFCEFVGYSLMDEANKNKNISPSEVEGYNYTSDSPESIDYGDTSADNSSPSSSSGGNQSADNNTGSPSHGGMGPGGSGGGFKDHEENGL